MQEMKIRCTSQEHADRVVAAARGMGYQIIPDYMDVESRGWDTLMLRAHGAGSFWSFYREGYPEYALYGDHLLPVSEGWIENKGECPVDKGTEIDVLYRDGDIAERVFVNQGSAVKTRRGDRRGAWFWGNSGSYGNIIAYRPARSLTPCEQRGLKVGQWVWCSVAIPPCWVRLNADNGSALLKFMVGDKVVWTSLEDIDFTQGIHDRKPDWTPRDKPQPIIPDEQIVQAAEAPVEWDGEGLPPVGADETAFVPTTAVSANYHGYKWEVVAHHNGKAVVVVSGQIASSAHLVSPCNIRPIQSERDKAISALASDLAIVRNSSIQHMSEYLYGVGWRQPETNNE